MRTIYGRPTCLWMVQDTSTGNNYAVPARTALEAVATVNGRVGVPVIDLEAEPLGPALESQYGGCALLGTV